MKIKYINHKFSKKSTDLLTKANNIIEEYQEQSYKLTLRQLYYQLVARDIIPNKDAQYRKLSGLLTNARLAGVVDWSAIEDRVRVPKRPYWVVDVEDALRDTIGSYRLDRTEGQEYYIEVWTEKDAISNILYRITAKYGVRLMVNRGYSSITAMHDAYKRLKAEKDWGKKLVVLYGGDHDPSGLDMIRDIIDRFSIFGLTDIEVVPIALTMPQIQQYNPPPNPAKISDPRAESYIENFGGTSWEVDALEPPVLAQIVEDAILKYWDETKYKSILKREKKEVKALRKFAKKFKS